MFAELGRDGSLRARAAMSSLSRCGLVPTSNYKDDASEELDSEKIFDEPRHFWSSLAKMRWRSLRGGAFFCLVLGGVFLTWWGWDFDGASLNSNSRGNEKTSTVQLVGPSSVIVESTRGDSVVRLPRVKEPLSSLPPEAFAQDDHPKDWDQKQSTERLQHLEMRFTAALAAIEKGEEPVAKHVLLAESALTSMRAELYGTPAGRAKHLSHESRLDHVLQEVTPE